MQVANEDTLKKSISRLMRLIINFNPAKNLGIVKKPQIL